MTAEAYEVDVEALRLGAKEIRAAGQPLHVVHAAVTGEIGAAVAMNMGYETSRALTHLARAVRDAARRAQDRLDEHVEALERCAANYEDVDRRSEEQFRAFLTR